MLCVKLLLHRHANGISAPHPQLLPKFLFTNGAGGIGLPPALLRLHFICFMQTKKGLTAKAEGCFPADHCATGVGCHTLVGACILGFHWVAYHQVPSNQPVP